MNSKLVMAESSTTSVVLVWKVFVQMYMEQLGVPEDPNPKSLWLSIKLVEVRVQPKFYSDLTYFTRKWVTQLNPEHNFQTHISSNIMIASLGK